MSSVFDDMFNVFDMPEWNTAGGLMRTDITEKDGMFYLDMDLPGFSKEDIKISLYNGNLTVSADHHETEEEKKEKGSLVRQERYLGSCSRTFRVDKAIRDSDVHASFRDGVLTLSIPSEKKKEADEKKFIDIL